MRYFVTFLIILLLIIFGVVIFKPSSRTSKTNQPAKTVSTLPDYSDTDAVVSYNNDGVINGDDVHRQIKISVSRLSRNVDVVQGYEGHILKSLHLPNNEAAYNVFLNALNNSGYTKLRKSSQIETGFCPLGNRYTFELTNTGGSGTDLNLWTSSCGGGTAAGQISTIQVLFQNQITGYDDFVSDVIL